MKRLRQSLVDIGRGRGKGSEEYRLALQAWEMEFEKFKASQNERMRIQRENRQRAKLWSDPNLSNFWNFVKQSTKPGIDKFGKG